MRTKKLHENASISKDLAWVYLMDIMLAASGMSAQRTRVNVVSANIANAQTTHTLEGGPYKKQNVVFSRNFIK